MLVFDKKHDNQINYLVNYFEAIDKGMTEKELERNFKHIDFKDLDTNELINFYHKEIKRKISDYVIPNNAPMNITPIIKSTLVKLVSLYKYKNTNQIDTLIECLIEKEALPLYLTYKYNKIPQLN